MAEPRAATSVACLLLLLVLACTSEATPADLDALTMRNYLEIGLDNEKICHPSSTKLESVAELRKYRDSAIIVKPSHVFDSWQMRYSKHCKFKIKGPKGDGLFAVVQRMSLRRNGSECLDYIQFIPENGSPSRKYCGKVENYNGVRRYLVNIESTGDEVHNSDTHYATNAKNDVKIVEEFSPMGKITTEIYISKQPLRTGESLDLIVSYTPYYQTCKKVDGVPELWSDSRTPEICISKKFICDGYVNCASLVCDDEHNCTTIIRKVISDEIGTKVTISAVTTVFLCFIIFVLCFWVCRKHEILCWSQDCAGPSAAAGNASSMSMERGQQSAASPPYVSTAPMLEVAVPSSFNDKDLPPSYDSLFPSQTNNAASM